LIDRGIDPKAARDLEAAELERRQAELQAEQDADTIAGLSEQFIDRWAKKHHKTAWREDQRMMDKDDIEPQATTEKARKVAIEIQADLAVPEFQGDDTGSDFNDLAEVAGSEIVKQQVMNATAPDAVKPLSLVPASEWSGLEIPRREWLIKDWVPLNQTTMLNGDGGIGKSLLLQQLQTCVATGTDFFGTDVKQGPSICVYCEDETSELQRRQKDINNALGVRYDQLSGCHVVSRLGHDTTY
jgi:hypothetical protein